MRKPPHNICTQAVGSLQVLRFVFVRFREGIGRYYAKKSVPTRGVWRDSFIRSYPSRLVESLERGEYVLHHAKGERACRLSG